MAKKTKMKVNTKPIEILELEFEDGVSRDIKFSNYALYILDNEFNGSIKTIINAFFKPYENGGKVLYAGMKACDENITYEYVQKLISNGSGMDINILMKVINMAFSAVGGDTDLKKLKKQMKDVTPDQIEMIAKMLQE